ncbi:helix-turn-helix domain-containing protein [uncultured Neglectibacter sp.]|uniref:helix-turn-helix domain-containing protein n=1 Tax=uncultured Neglectibacter sp. TaxID=1924108 RepID=UPI0034DE8311
MIDYKSIGAHIRTARQDQKMTQEQLADAVGVGVTHISHIETGNSIPSLQVFVDILNALDCSADELLCIELKKAKPQFDDWIGEIFSDCSDKERKLLTDTVLALKASMRRLEIEGQG